MAVSEMTVSEMTVSETDNSLLYDSNKKFYQNVRKTRSLQGRNIRT